MDIIVKNAEKLRFDLINLAEISACSKSEIEMTVS